MRARRLVATAVIAAALGASGVGIANAATSNASPKASPKASASQSAPAHFKAGHGTAARRAHHCPNMGSHSAAG